MRATLGNQDLGRKLFIPRIPDELDKFELEEK